MRILKKVLNLKQFPTYLQPISNKKTKQINIVIEGNIACGKTTFLEHFQKYKNVNILTEPVDMWRNCRGHNLLDIMYHDPKQWSFPFQVFATLTMLQRHVSKTDKPINLMERSIYSARYCFVEKNSKDGILAPPHHAILDEQFSWIIKNINIPIDLIVYLRSTPEVAYGRMMMRGRNEEKLVPFEYIQDLHNYHENWLYHKTAFSLPAPVITLNADLDTSIIGDEYKKFESHLMHKVSAHV